MNCCTVARGEKALDHSHINAGVHVIATVPCERVSPDAVEKLLQTDQTSMRKARFNHLRLRRTSVSASKSGDAATASDNTMKMPLLCRGLKD